MKKSDIVGRVANRMGLTTSAAEGAVDTVLESIAEAVAKEQAGGLPGSAHSRRRAGAPGPGAIRRPG